MKPNSLPLLPLLLWETPPGLELILRQEGIAFRQVEATDPSTLLAGRFLLYDSREASLRAIAEGLSRDHRVIDIHPYRRDEPSDPFEALIDRKPALAEWKIAGLSLRETVARQAKGIIRERLLEALRASVAEQGGVWARLSPYPYPYQSAFNFRADLDEDNPDDYARFADARRPLEDCATHFVSTFAYAQRASVLDDLKRLDTQSHGHFHHIYDDPRENRSNLQNAHAILFDFGFDPKGFAAPHGRWTLASDACLEALGYEYASDFQIGYDDFPFFPWIGERFSRVLQIPIHPICEGLFLDAGAMGGTEVAEHLVEVVQSRLDGHLPAFVYGHPERRIARYPEILQRLAVTIAGARNLWRVTLTEFAAWWKFRDSQEWTLLEREDGEVELRRAESSPLYAMSVEIRRGNERATFPLERDRTLFALDDLRFKNRRLRFDRATPSIIQPPVSLKATVRRAIDWETVTPLDALPSQTPAQRLKRRIRRLKDSVSEGVTR